MAQAEARRDSDPRLALQLSLAAHKIHPTVETGSSLYTTLTSTPLTATLTGHTDPVWSVAFSPDGRTLATASDDNTAGLWDVGGILELSGQLVKRSCAAAGEGLDQERWHDFAPEIPYQPTC